MKKLIIMVVVILTLTGCGKKNVNTQKETVLNEEETIVYYEDVSTYW